MRLTKVESVKGRLVLTVEHDNYVGSFLGWLFGKDPKVTGTYTKQYLQKFAADFFEYPSMEHVSAATCLRLYDLLETYKLKKEFEE